MSREQYLLICFAEECSELAQAALKAARFGLDDDFHKEPEKQPRQLLNSEWNDVCGVAKMLIAAGHLSPESPATILKKMEKVERFMCYSHERGRVDRCRYFPPEENK